METLQIWCWFVANENVKDTIRTTEKKETTRNLLLNREWEKKITLTKDENNEMKPHPMILKQLIREKGSVSLKKKSLDEKWTIKSKEFKPNQEFISQ